MDSFASMATSLLPLTTSVPLPLADVLWMVILGFIISFVLSVAIGANDVANSFGTSVGSKVLTLRQALFLATIFETLGAVLMGSKVAETIQKGIFDVDLYEGRQEVLMAGEIAALAACATWLFVATGLKMPVSTTHSIVGASLGFHLVVFGVNGVNWLTIGLIAISWVSSPVLSGLASALIFAILRYFILKKEEPLEPGLRSLPVWYSLVIIVNFFSIFYQGPEALGFDKIPLWGVFVLSFGSGLVTGVVVWFIVVPYLRKRVKASSNAESTGKESSTEAANEERKPIYVERATYVNDNVSLDNVDLLTSAEDMAVRGDEEQTIEAEREETEGTRRRSIRDSAKDEEARPAVGGDGDSVVARPVVAEGNRSVEKPDGAPLQDQEVKDHPHVVALCSPLQVLSAVFASFAHGSNDVSNAVAPLIGIWLIYRTGEVSQEEAPPLWVLFYGSVGICLGLWVLGRRVIQTVGEDITPLTPSSGFSVELGAAMTVLLATNIGIPVSTTHCKIGSVVSVGWLRERQAVNWSLFGGIVLAWVVTLPITVGLSAAFMALLQLTL